MIEKQSRERLSLKFIQLEAVLSHRRHPQNNMGITPDKIPQRVRRGEILKHAHDDILELQAEVKLTKERLATLRETTFPDTCRFTLHDDE